MILLHFKVNIEEKLKTFKTIDAVTVQTAYNLLLNFCMGTYIKYLKTILYRFFFFC